MKHSIDTTARKTVVLVLELCNNASASVQPPSGLGSSLIFFFSSFFSFPSLLWTFVGQTFSILVETTERQKSYTTKKILIFRTWKYLNSLQIMWNETMSISASVFKRESRKQSSQWTATRRKWWGYSGRTPVLHHIKGLMLWPKSFAVAWTV